MHDPLAEEKCDKKNWIPETGRHLANGGLDILLERVTV